MAHLRQELRFCLSGHFSSCFGFLGFVSGLAQRSFGLLTLIDHPVKRIRKHLELIAGIDSRTLGEIPSSYGFGHYEQVAQRHSEHSGKQKCRRDQCYQRGQGYADDRISQCIRSFYELVVWKRNKQ